MMIVGTGGTGSGDGSDSGSCDIWSTIGGLKSNGGWHTRILVTHDC